MTLQPTGLAGQIAGFQQSRDARDIEYDAFSRVTRNLMKARTDESSLVRAASDNVELWTVLAADLADEGNALPESLRASLISLAIFSIRHGHQVMNGKAGPDPLIEVNKSIMKGLRGEVAA